MIGRGAYGRPWLLSQVKEALRTGRLPPAPSLARQRDLVLDHYQAMLSHYGQHIGVRVARKHLAWYVRDFAAAADFRKTVNRDEDPRSVMALIREIYESEQEFRVVS
jgi:tRNA-dihydrouridine synthase B